MFRFLVVAVLFAAVAAFMPANRMIARKAELSMVSQWQKTLGVAAMGVALAGPLPSFADGAISASTVYRTRNNYGAKILALETAVEKGDFATLGEKKVKNTFDLFISGANARPGATSKANKAEETKLEVLIRFNQIIVNYILIILGYSRLISLPVSLQRIPAK